MSEDLFVGIITGLMPYFVTMFAAWMPKKWRKRAKQTRNIVRLIDGIAMNVKNARNES